MADSIEAVETEPQAQASRLMREILKYHGEDLGATGFVYQRIVTNSREPVGN
jgi:hypothetical protein